MKWSLAADTYIDLNINKIAIPLVSNVLLFNLINDYVIMKL